MRRGIDAKSCLFLVDGVVVGGGRCCAVSNAKTVDVSPTFGIINEQFVAIEIGRRTATGSTVRPVL